MKRPIVLLFLAACAAEAPLPTDAPAPKGKPDAYASGQPLLPEQEAYDVRHYSLELRIDPESKSIDGSLTATVLCKAPLARVILDLDGALTVSGADEEGEARAFHHEGGLVWVELGRWAEEGDEVSVRIRYGGKPRVAPNPPWDGGFTWTKTPDGRPWIATTCQMNGADLWWPSKDHPSDKPETMDLRITVPDRLIVASNGTLRSVEARDGLRTFHWHIANPISNYNVALNIAPYEVLRETYTSVTGENVPVEFYVLPGSVEKGSAALPAFLEHVRFLEEICGPYPFRNEKYGIAETPHLGMEHQTIIAYGNKFQADARGYDWLHHHELSHEWWGNLVTNRNWKDMWIHEGIGTYMQWIYLERKFGRDALLADLRRSRHGNAKPVAPREPTDTRAIYGGDIYGKGAYFMHTLRWLLGDEVFFRVLRRLAYPDPAKERVTDGTQCRFSDTDEIRAIVERESGQKLGWLFDVYLHQPHLPELTTRREGDDLVLEWKAPGGAAFPMPVPVKVGDAIQRVAMPGGRVKAEGAEIDPDRWLLKQ